MRSTSALSDPSTMARMFDVDDMITHGFSQADIIDEAPEYITILVESSPLDDPSYRVTRLPNQSEAPLAHDAETNIDQKPIPMDSQRPDDVSPEVMQARIEKARREAEILKDRIKRKKDEMAANKASATRTPLLGKWESSGIASLRLSFPDDPGKTWDCDFAIVEKCAAPMTLGKAFLDATEVFTRFSHRLTKGALHMKRTIVGGFKKIRKLMLMKNARQKLGCQIDGDLVFAIADSGSDIDLVSREYAQFRGWDITT
ncbi:putative Peptidase A2 domain-containing protein [Seiridium cardinale]|uniref:Peptidase A2 domain-containing protein n=1 Tax=Seiridium cardinale TaxID=138064 RepID=A0ABR2Y6I6_9PEZI